MITWKIKYFKFINDTNCAFLSLNGHFLDEILHNPCKAKAQQNFGMGMLYSAQSLISLLYSTVLARKHFTPSTSFRPTETKLNQI